MSKVIPDSSMAAKEVARWESVRGPFHKVKPDFWKVDKLNPRFAPASSVIKVFEILGHDLQAWKNIIEAGLDFSVLYSKRHRHVKELSSHPLQKRIQPERMFRKGKETELVEVIRFLTQHGLDINARGNHLPLIHDLINYTGHGRNRTQSGGAYEYTVPELLAYTIPIYEDLGLDLTSRDKKGNTFLHGAVLNGNWIVVQSILEMRPEAWEWKGEHDRTLLEFIQKKVMRDTRAGQIHGFNATNLPFLLARQELSRIIPELPSSAIPRPSVRL